MIHLSFGARPPGRCELYFWEFAPFGIILFQTMITSDTPTKLRGGLQGGCMFRF